MALMTDIAATYQNLVTRMHQAAQQAGRDGRTIRFLAASKSQSSDAVRAAVAAGVRLVGENYVQEAQAKKPAISESVEWHMIGHLQRNKAKAAAELFDVIQSLDSAALARALNGEGERRGKIIRTFIEVNLAGEESKSGVAPDQLERFLDEIAGLRHLAVEGLMTVPPMQKDPEAGRPYFRALREFE